MLKIKNKIMRDLSWSTKGIDELSGDIIAV
jgi:hypothetical protein